MRTLPAASRNGGGALPVPSRRRVALPRPSHRLLTASDVPPLPQFQVFVAADALAIVQPSVKVRVTARVAATVTAEVAASAAVRADGGRKFVDADHDVSVTPSASVFVRYRRTATATASVAAAADAGAGARPQFGTTVTAAAVVNAIRTALAAVNDISVTATAEIVAYGGQMPVDADQTASVTASATAVPRIHRGALITTETTPAATRVLRMAAAASQECTVTATAAIQVPVTATVTATVSATADARIPFSALGMDKSGTFTRSDSSATTAVKVTGWAPQAGTAASAIVNDELVVNGTGNITVTLSAQLGGAVHRLILYRNGVEISRVNGNSSSTAPTVLTITGDVVVGDSFAMWWVKGVTPARSVDSASLSYVIN